MNLPKRLPTFSANNQWIFELNVIGLFSYSDIYMNTFMMHNYYTYLKKIRC